MKDKTLKQLVESIKASGKPKTSAYDTSATVTRVENGTAWVHIPGGVRETPVKLTIAAKAGDNVQVRVSGGRAFMVGNASAPPTDDRVATQALTETKTINKVVKAVQAVAEKAAKIAGNTNQYFWHTQEGSDTGAHITEIPREDFLADPENGGGNLLARSNGVAIRYGLNELAQFTNSSINFFDGQGDALSNILAQFGVGGLVLGNNVNTRIVINTTNGIRIGDKVEINTNGEATMQNISIDSGVISGFTIRKNSSSAYYPSYSDGEIVPTASGDITADDTTHIITVNADTTVTYTFPATVDGSKASNICYAPIYQFTDEEDVVSSTVIITYLNAGVVINSTQYQSSYRSAGSWYAWLDKANANSATTITVSFTLIAGATIYAYMTYGTDDALTYNTSEFLRVDNPDLPSVYIGINGISVSDKIGLSPNGTVHADTVELSGEGTILELTDSDTERRFLFSNIANDTGKTYADDGVYPHRATFYGGNAQSPIALGAWDGRNQHTIWRYNDHDQYLELHNRVRVGGKTLNLGNLFKAPGDTWTVDYAGGGYVTDNGKKFQWSVPTPYITGTVSVTALTGHIRQNGNYLVGSASAAGTFPIGNITVQKMTGFVRFTYDASSAPTGVVNNDAISVQLHITFTVA